MQELAPGIFDMEVSAPEIALHSRAGQFVMVRAFEQAERIPLTIAQANPNRGSIRLVFQVVGTSTFKMGKLKTGEIILNVAGPLGKPSELMSDTVAGDRVSRNVLLIGGGVGIAALLPIAQGLYQAGNPSTVILGAKSASFLILREEFDPISQRVILCTDDGSAGRKGFVTDAMQELLSAESFETCWAVGPTLMMKKCSEIALKNNLKIWTSLNPVMVDGTGMCGGCRVEVDHKTYFACVDGPEFDGRFVDWQNLLLRQRQFKEEEAVSYHLCQLEKR